MILWPSCASLRTGRGLRGRHRRQPPAPAMEIDDGADVDIADAVAVGQAECLILADIAA